MQAFQRSQSIVMVCVTCAASSQFLLFNTKKGLEDWLQCLDIEIFISDVIKNAEEVLLIFRQFSV